MGVDEARIVTNVRIAICTAACKIRRNCKVWGLVDFSANTRYLSWKNVAENMVLSFVCDFAVLLLRFGPRRKPSYGHDNA